MSVLIKGMEMPNSCYDCRLFVDSWCYAFGIDDWRNAYNKPPKGERLDNCPLIEVPTPHGRLIDADAFKKDECNRCYGACESLPCDCLNCEADCRCDFIKDIADAPTIILAEDGENGT